MYCYLLECTTNKKTYIGATKNVETRLSQHNGKKSGGARSTRGYSWKCILYVGGFPTWSSTLQFEYSWKRIARHNYGVQNKVHGLRQLLELQKSTKTAPPFHLFRDKLCLYVAKDSMGYLEKIEGFKQLLDCGGSPFSTIHSNTYFQSYFLSKHLSLHSFQMSSTVASTSDIMTLSHTVEMLANDVRELTTRLSCALKAMESMTAAAGSNAVAADVPTDTKKVRKPREKKEKPTCPEAAPGVVRFYSTNEGPFKDFSNFKKCQIVLNNKEYISVENWIQSQKFVGTDDEYAEKIRTTSNPALTRIMGKSKKHPIREDWDNIRNKVMLQGLRAKFKTHTALTDLLLSTGNALIEEESPTDSYWGIGVDGTGNNTMGKLLMQVREELKTKSSTQPLVEEESSDEDDE